MTRTIVKIGNSQGIIIPNEILKKLGVTKGDAVDIDIEDTDRVILSKKGSKKTSPRVSTELLNWLDGFNKRYKNALRELASK